MARRCSTDCWTTRSRSGRRPRLRLPLRAGRPARLRQRGPVPLRDLLPGSRRARRREPRGPDPGPARRRHAERRPADPRDRRSSPTARRSGSPSGSSTPGTTRSPGADPLSLSELQDRFQTGALPPSRPAGGRPRALLARRVRDPARLPVRAVRRGHVRHVLLLRRQRGRLRPAQVPVLRLGLPAARARFRDRLAFHDHLVRQRFLPAGRHTPARATALVRAMEHGSPSATPSSSRAMSTGGGEPPEYGALMDALNAARLSAALRAAFDQHGFALSAGAKAFVDVRDAAWRVRDTLTQDQDTFPVEYAVGEEVDLGQGQRQARRPGHRRRRRRRGVPPALPRRRRERRPQGPDRARSPTGSTAIRPDAPNVERFDALSALLAANGASGTTFTMGDARPARGRSPATARSSRPPTRPPSCSPATSSSRRAACTS